ncbi:hypothetical protein CXG81DRAFT_28344 [Caulochytrium protostelioides]|uniref:FZ domain-containing protein n=1 Tax=Caulochytrium protostelioides TaxID=1555241 RepID=A0A4V1IU04_9FUNG|nr:hypothetical protein CXG81DRAFT_28344 [Caulochytrium protostelioides]|eukprot:RKO98867.1 hypothetical protein CXG81DRAFT_28344 [Caulochytrium protostelioides]
MAFESAFPTCITAVRYHTCATLWPPCATSATPCPTSCGHVLAHCGVEAPGAPFAALNVAIDEVAPGTQNCVYDHSAASDPSVVLGSDAASTTTTTRIPAPTTTTTLALATTTTTTEVTASVCVDTALAIVRAAAAASQQDPVCPLPFVARPGIHAELERYRDPIKQHRLAPPLCLGVCCLPCDAHPIWPEGFIKRYVDIQILLLAASAPLWLFCLTFQFHPSRYKYPQYFLTTFVIGHVFMTLSAMIQAPRRGNICSRTIYTATAFFDGDVAPIGWFMDMGSMWSVAMNLLFLVHMLERMTFNSNRLQRYIFAPITGITIVCFAKAIVFTALGSFRLSPNTAVTFEMTSPYFIGKIVSMGTTVVLSVLAAIAVIGYLLFVIYQQRSIFRSQTEFWERALQMIGIQWRTYVCLMVIALTWSFSLAAHVIVTPSIKAMYQPLLQEPHFSTWATCLFQGHARSDCEGIMALRGFQLYLVMLPGLINGVFSCLMPPILLLRSSNRALLERLPYVGRYLRSKPAPPAAPDSLHFKVISVASMCHELSPPVRIATALHDVYNSGAITAGVPRAHGLRSPSISPVSGRCL